MYNPGIIFDFILNKSVVQIVLNLLNNKDNSEYNCNYLNNAFRIKKYPFGNVNIELHDTLELNELITDKNDLKFYKPVCFYISSHEKLNLVILGEYYDDFFKYLNELSNIPDFNYMNLDFVDNAIIAAFSFQAREYSRCEIDLSIEANGLTIEIIMCFNGYPQVFLSDQYNFKGPIAAYFMNEKIPQVKPMVEFKTQFDKLASMGLLSALSKR